MNLSEPDKLGLVFSGGGAKGAYQIGVWKALIQLGLDKQIKAVSGTSVGAINSALFCQGNYEIAEQIWLGITKSKILTPDAGLILQHIGAGLLAKGGLLKKAMYVGKSIINNGVFSRKGLIAILEKYLEVELIKKSLIPLYICTLNISNGKLDTIKLNNRSEESIKSFLLATSAIPAIFKHEKIGSNHHLDGGLIPFINDNTPFKVLIEKEQCTKIINVFLTTRPALKEQKKFSDVEFINIFPSEKFEGPIPSLNFSSRVSAKFIQRGYDDALKVL